MTDRPTIFALSSGRPPAAIAVIRISGSRAGDALKALGVKIPEPRKAALARIRDADNEIIDEALALWFPAPNSETGEDTAELQLHGGRAVIAGVLDALGSIEGLRPAEAGEFTRRAFENGKLDLTAVEGLADLVAAETQGQRRQAFRQMKGLLGDRAETWRQQLIQALALVEARIDFSDEGDVPENLVAPALDMARVLVDEIAAALADGGRGERLREGLVVAIAGPPNAGKSTLLNLLARREAAIVSPYAGTTRDIIEVHLELGGLPVTLLDTAGIRETTDPVELEGVRRARERAQSADLVLWVTDASTPGTGGPMADTGNTAVIPGRPAEGGRTRNPEADPAAPGFRVRAFGASRNDSGLGRGPEADARPRPGSIFADRGYRFRGPDDLPAPAAVSSPRASIADLGPATAPAAATSSPPIWLIRNKIDLIQGDSIKSERRIQGIDKDELVTRSNKTLRFIVNSGLADKSEDKLQTNDPLPNVVNQRLTAKSELESSKNDRAFNISATSGAGFEDLVSELTRYAESFLAGTESALVTRARHRHALEETLAALRRALGDQAAGREDLLAEELRIATRALGRLTGRVDVEDILDVIFRDFCIGK